MVKIRLWGLEKEMQAITREILNVPQFDILSVSAPYRDKPRDGGVSSYSRVYIDVELIDPQKQP